MERVVGEGTGGHQPRRRMGAETYTCFKVCGEGGANVKKLKDLVKELYPEVVEYDFPIGAGILH